MLQKLTQSKVFMELFKKIMLLYEHFFGILTDLSLYIHAEMYKYLISFKHKTRLRIYYSFIIQIFNNNRNLKIN